MSIVDRSRCDRGHNRNDCDNDDNFIDTIVIDGRHSVLNLQRERELIDLKYCGLLLEE